jgi:hypothetical protein
MSNDIHAPSMLMAGYVSDTNFKFGRLYGLMEVARVFISSGSPHPVWMLEKKTAQPTYAWYLALRELKHISIHVSVRGTFVSDEIGSYLIANHITWYVAHPGVRNVASVYEAKLRTGQIEYPTDDIIFPIMKDLKP